MKGGERLLARAVPPAMLRIGDMVAYRSGGGLVCHRLVGRRGGKLYLRGDRQFGPAEAVAPEAVAGVVCVLLSDGKIIMQNSVLRRCQGILIAFFGPLLSACADFRNRLSGQQD